MLTIGGKSSPDLRDFTWQIRNVLVVKWFNCNCFMSDVMLVTECVANANDDNNASNLPVVIMYM